LGDPTNDFGGDARVWVNSSVRARCKPGCSMVGYDMPNTSNPQLQAFAGGTRHNDICHRMRGVAAKLTPNEIRLAAIRYSRQ